MLSALSGSHSDIFYSRMFNISYQDAENYKIECDNLSDLFIKTL